MASSVLKALKFSKQTTCLCRFPRNLSGIGGKEDWVPQEKKTHTGQEWEKDDYRLVRFIDRPKQVNERFAIDLINEIPPKGVAARGVWCDGGGGALGHPKVYINLDPAEPQACGYCGLRFFQEKH
uniref:Zinc finger CHCC-type domain-containing protein n=1 Tax=Strigamia maritima TaxID=126957 RepID=T1J807_STRMM